jgi:hypothetical protein
MATATFDQTISEISFVDMQVLLPSDHACAMPVSGVHQSRAVFVSLSDGRQV